MLIQERLRDDVIRTPLKVGGPRVARCAGGESHFAQGAEGVGRSRGRHSLAYDDGARLGPGVEHRRIRGLAAVAGGGRSAPTIASGHINTIARRIWSSPEGIGPTERWSTLKVRVSGPPATLLGLAAH